MFLSFDGFQPENVLISFLFSMEQSWQRLLPTLVILCSWGYLEYICFNTTPISSLPQGNIQLHHKRSPRWRSSHSFASKFLRKI